MKCCRSSHTVALRLTKRTTKKNEEALALADSVQASGSNFSYESFGKVEVAGSKPAQGSFSAYVNISAKLDKRINQPASKQRISYGSTT